MREISVLPKKALKPKDSAMFVTVS